MTAIEVVTLVEAMQEAAHYARSWTEPSSCLPAESMPCQHPGCIARAEQYTADFAREAFHLAGILQSAVEQGMSRPEAAERAFTR